MLQMLCVGSVPRLLLLSCILLILWSVYDILKVSQEKKPKEKRLAFNILDLKRVDLERLEARRLEVRRPEEKKLKEKMLELKKPEEKRPKGKSLGEKSLEETRQKAERREKDVEANSWERLQEERRVRLARVCSQQEGQAKVKARLNRGDSK